MFLPTTAPMPLPAAAHLDDHRDDHLDDHQHGPTLASDLHTLAVQQAGRRGLLRWLSAASLGAGLPLALAACGGGADDAGTASAGSGSSGSTGGSSGSTGGSTGSSGSSGSSGSTTVSSCSTIPTETAGPYPADGSLASSQRLNALALSGIVRRDIRTSVGTASGTAPGVPLTVTLQLVNSSGSCANLAGYAVYLWHCTRDGSYSMYSSSVAGENFLRGVQVSDANGQVTFTTIFPGCYSGRWPHIHFEVYASQAAATDSAVVGDHIQVSQLALPAATCSQVYNSSTGYSASISNFAAISLASDNVFSNDQAALQMATVSGDNSSGYTATLVVGVAV